MSTPVRAVATGWRFTHRGGWLNRQLSFGACTVALLALCLLAPPAVAADPPPTEARIDRRADDGRDAFGLRLGLLCFVGLALAGGAYAQHHSLATLRRADRSPRRNPPHAAPRHERRREPQATTTLKSPQHWGDLGGQQPPRAQPSTQRPAAIEAHCARAIAAAQRYDRRTTLAAFASALARDPEVRPASYPGFWEMPSGGHADLARAYLERGQLLDARSVLTVATMLFPHNRELEALAREAAPGDSIGRTA